MQLLLSQPVKELFGTGCQSLKAIDRVPNC